MTKPSLLLTRDVPMVARDGVTMRSDLWEPAGAPAGPAILWRTPYLTEDALPCGFLDPRVAIDRGYRIVVQDVRGSGTSGGALEPWVNEEADGVDAVAWVAEQPWCDGRVVMAGYSYVGATQWLAAVGAPPALCAIAPSISGDRYGEGWAFRDGVREHALLTSWLAAGLAPPDARWLDDVDRAFTNVDELLEIVPWAAPWFAQDADSDYWAARDVRARRGAIDVPVLSIGGWYDTLLADTLAAHAASRHPFDRLIVGPWAHEIAVQHLVGERNVGFAANAAAFGLTARMCDFYDAVLDGREPPLAPVTAYVLGAREWREWPSWPPPEARPLDLTLGAGEFSVDPADPVPAWGGRALRLWSADWGYGIRDQRPLAARADVLALELEPVAEDTVLAGPVTATLAVEADGGTERDWVVTLAVEAADGRWDNLAETIARRPVAAREVVAHLGDVCVQLTAGQRLVVLVAGSSWPRWRPLPVAGRQRVREGTLRVTACG
jgi:putative CocE/NonD family hydrolase